MDLLKRDLAPVLPEAWTAIDGEAARVLKLNLAGRKLVDFKGPKGWRKAAVNTGRLKLVPDRTDDVNLGIREVQRLVELRVPIKLPIMELDSMARGATNPDLGPVVKAAEKVAHLEDSAIFNGLKAAEITGLLPASPHPAASMTCMMSEMPCFTKRLTNRIIPPIPSRMSNSNPRRTFIQPPLGVCSDRGL